MIFVNRSTALAVAFRVEYTGLCLEVQERNVRIYTLSPVHLRGQNGIVQIYQDLIPRLPLTPHILAFPSAHRSSHRKGEETGRGLPPSVGHIAEPRFTLSKQTRVNKYLQKDCRMKLMPVLYGRLLR